MNNMENQKQNLFGSYTSEHFTRSEFACRCGCGFDRADCELVKLLDEITSRASRRIIISSGCRCAAHNRNVGGAKHSQHLWGRAADILIHDDNFRHEILKLCLSRFSRVGMGRHFVHVDIKETPKNVFWIY